MKLHTLKPQTLKLTVSFITALLTVCLWLPQICGAHTLFLQSARFSVYEGKASPLFFCYGHHTPVSDGIRGKKLNNITVTNPEGISRQIAIRNETGLHSYMVSYDMPGTWMLTAETNPGFYTVYIDQKGIERHSIKPMSKIGGKAKKIIKSLYSKQYTKTYIACGSPSKNNFQQRGLDLELVPLNDLFSLKPGETLEFEVFYNGKPYDGEGTWDATYDGFSTLAEDFFYAKTKVSGNRFSIPLPEPGRWFVRYSIKIDAPESEMKNYKQLKQTATLTFQIDNKRKRQR